MTKGIPPTWRIVELREIATFVSGGTPSRKNPDYFAGTIPWLTGYDLPEGQVTFVDDSREYITGEAVNRSATSPVPPNTVLLTTRVTVGKVAIARKKLCFSQDVTGIIINNTEIIDPIYLAYCLFASQEILLLRNRGTTIQGVIRRDLERFQVPLPPLSEQEYIVEILRQAANLRYLRYQAEKSAWDLLNALYYDVFLKDEKTFQTWRTIRLGKVAPFITSGSRGWAKYYSETGGKFIRVQNVLEGELDLSDLVFVQAPEGPEKERSKIIPGDLLITITGTVGRVVVAPDEIGEAYVSQHVAIIRLDGSMNPQFIAAFLNHPLGGQIQVARHNYGQTKPGLNLTQIQSIRIPRPPDDLIVVYEKQANEIRKLKSHWNSSMAMLDDLQKSLLTRAFTGELTAKWHDRRAEKLIIEANQRDEALGLRPGIVTAIEPASEPTITLDETHPRFTVLRELSETQKQVYQVALQTEGYLTAENLLLENGLSPDTVRRTLSLLETLGLVIRVSLPATPSGDSWFYVRVFRAPQATDDSSSDDLATLKDFTRS